MGEGTAAGVIDGGGGGGGAVVGFVSSSHVDDAWLGIGKKRNMEK